MNFWLAFILSFISVICLSILGIYLGKVGQKYGPFWTTFWMEVLGLPLTLILAPIFGLSLAVNQYFWLLGIFGIGIMGVLMLMTKSLSIGPNAVVQAIARLGNIITFFLAVLFLHESVSITQIIGICLLLLGATAVALDFEQLQRRHVRLMTSAVPLAVIAACISGILFFFLGIATKHFDGFSASVGTRLFAVPTMLLLSIRQDKPQVPMFKTSWRVLLGIVIADVVAYTFYNLAVQVYQVSFATMMQSLVPVFAALLSFFLFQERLHRSQLIGIALAVIGAAVMSVG